MHTYVPLPDIVTVVRCGNCKEGGCGDRSSSGKKVRCGGRSLGGGDGGGRELTSWMMIWGLSMGEIVMIEIGIGVDGNNVFFYLVSS